MHVLCPDNGELAVIEKVEQSPSGHMESVSITGCRPTGPVPNVSFSAPFCFGNRVHSVHALKGGGNTGPHLSAL